MTEDPLDDRYLEQALRERFGAQSPPDLRERVLASTDAEAAAAVARATRASRPTPKLPGRPLVAALVALGLSVVLTLALWRETTDAETAGPQEPVAAFDGELVRPSTFEQMRELLQQVEGISVEIYTTTEHSVELRGGPGSIARLTPDQVKAVTAAMTGSLKSNLPAGWDWPNRFVLHLPGNRGIIGSLYMLGDSDWHVSGLGILNVNDALHKTLRPLVLEAERRARFAQGVAFADKELRLPPPRGLSRSLRKISGHRLTGSGLEALRGFEQLDELDLSGSGRTLSDDDLRHLAGLPVRTFTWRYATCSDAGLEHLAALPKLELLDLTYVGNSSKSVQGDRRCTGTGFSSFAEHGRLRRVSLASARHLTKEGVQALSAVATIEELDLERASTEGLDAVCRLTRLRRLDLSDSRVDVNPLLEQAGTLRNIEWLDLSGTAVNGKGLVGLPNMSDLRHLDLSGCGEVDQFAMAILSTHRKLEHLDLSRCSKLDGSALVHLAPLTALRELNLSQLKIGDGLDDAIDGLFELRRLDLSFTNIGDTLIERVARLPELQHLRLVRCEQLTDAALAALEEAKALRDLNLSYCHGLSANAVLQLRNALPDCEIEFKN